MAKRKTEKKMGRPRMEDPACENVKLRVTPGELAALKVLSEQEGGTISSFLRHVINEHISNSAGAASPQTGNRNGT